MNRFCLKQGQGLKASAAHPQAELPLSNPPGGRPSTFAPKLRDLFFFCITDLDGGSFN